MISYPTGEGKPLRLTRSDYRFLLKESLNLGYNEIYKKVQKSLIPYLPAPPSVGTACLPVSRGPVGRYYETVTRIIKATGMGLGNHH